MSILRKLDEFRADVMEQARPETPCPPSPEKALTCSAIIMEEVSELVRALAARDVVGIADGVADLIVVATQASYFSGIDIEPILEEVHRSNMTKRGGYYDAAGKFCKPATYSAPQVGWCLVKQGWVPPEE